MQDSKLPKRQYTDEFKTEALRLSESIGVTKRHADWAFRWPRWATGSDAERLQGSSELARRKSLQALQPCRRVAW